jgi:energy-coupling factor transporter transmembrane protein EcfT
MVGTLLVRSIERSERLARAMEARGFGGEFPRPTPQALRKRECGILVAVLLLQVAIGGLR